MGCGASKAKEDDTQNRDVQNENKEKKDDAPAPEKTEEAPPAASSGSSSNKKKGLWDDLRAKLPREKKNAEQRKQRKQLFKDFDPNGNGYLSLAEVDAGCRKELQLDQLTDDLAPILMRAFTSAKGVRQGKGKGKKQGEDYVEWPEFRLLLVGIYQYFELWFMFDEIDSSDDRRVNLDEFKQAVSKLGEWGVTIDDADASFAEIDKNGGGIILFKEFADWALQKGLDAEDPDTDADDE